jgi:hypothetical protein
MSLGILEKLGLKDLDLGYYFYVLCLEVFFDEAVFTYESQGIPMRLRRYTGLVVYLLGRSAIGDELWGDHEQQLTPRNLR